MSYRRTATIPIFTIGEIKRMAKKQLSGKWRRLFPVMLVYTLCVTLPAIFISVGSYVTDMIRISELLGTDAADQNLAFLESSGLSGITAAAGLLTAVSFYIFLTTGPFKLSYADLSLRILRNEPFSVKTVFSGFSRFAKAFVADLLITIFSSLWLTLFILPSIMLVGAARGTDSFILLTLSLMIFLAILIGSCIFLMRYEMTYFLISDDDFYTSGECVTRSVRMMKKNLSNYFMLRFSFLPWILLFCVPVVITVIAATAAVYLPSGTYAVLSAVTAVVFGIISLIASIFLNLYMQAASAVFYSGASGNFRSSASGSDVKDVIIPVVLPDTDNNGENVVIIDSPGCETTEIDMTDIRISDSSVDETLSILEKDDSLDDLYDEDETEDRNE